MARPSRTNSFRRLEVNPSECVTRGLLIYLYIYMRYTKHIILHVIVCHSMLIIICYICHLVSFVIYTVIRQSYVILSYITYWQIMYIYLYIHTCIMFRLAQIESGISRITHFISYIIPHVCIRSWSTSQNWNKHRHSQVVLWVVSQLPTVRRSFIQSYRPTARPQDLFGEAFACFAWTWDRLSQSPEKAFKWTKFWWGLESPIV